MNINSRTSKINFTGYASGSTATFTGLREAPVKLRAYINAIQSGSGDPSPDNVRPIIGRDSVTITTNSVDHMISLGDTYYGGYLDVTTGVLTVDRGYKTVGELNWAYTSGKFYSTSTIGMKKTTGKTIISSAYATVNNIKNLSVTMPDLSVCVINNPSGLDRVYITDSNYTDAQTFKTAMSDVQLVYELATPITVQLTPTQVEQLLGVNNVFADCGNVEVYYVTI